ncbi:ARM repeat-containing protein [Dichomitus squalens LYAD-421 SS1]|uniref:ARM repeat-containing protein n=1 Tax=Dichomitus squalens (strain LYAD-421) TaxID=732165 RepID=R7T235_DICSQ|nr:ARM repeat-containing protein [Dichomitus squalens LYAD-421 SS1]EJF62368.1 ARM repeat-containing protein [Dichomitus squalens LYAD-421 SS1]
MDSGISKQLVDKMYEKRKAAALELEKQIRESHQQGDQRRISQIVDQLVEMFSNPSNPLHVRNGGLIGLAGTAIALGVDIAPYMEKFVEPLLVCFTDPENRVRYFSAECLYNIAKVSKGEILVYFNPIFDALSKLAADSELSVKNGAELLDRLLKDIVAETASVYIPQYPETEAVRRRADEANGILVPHPDDVANGADISRARKAFSLPHFIPLLSDRIYVLSPFTRSYLVSWITVLDSVPELELITYLPEFLDGLLKYLSDPTDDVRVATESLLADFLREIKEVTVVQKRHEDQLKAKREATITEASRRIEAEKEKLPDITMEHPERAPFISENDDVFDNDLETPDEKPEEQELRDTGAWVPGQGVRIDYAAIVEILLAQLDDQHDEIQQSTALRWLCEFLSINQDVMIPFTPRLILAILPNLAHDVPMIQSAATRTNQALLNVIQSLPVPPEPVPGRQQTQGTDRSSNASVAIPSSPTPTPPTLVPTRQPTGAATRDSGSSRDISSPESPPEVAPQTVVDRAPPSGLTTQIKSRSATVSSETPPRAVNQPIENASQAQVQNSRPESPVSAISVLQTQQSPESSMLQERDQIDYQATVNALTIQFLSEHEETRVAALKWLIMLHQKAPKKILAMDDGTFPALLKTLSDSSEEVIKHDLQLLAQISSSSEEGYFKLFMNNLLELFSTDRGLLDSRGSLIIRQLCLNLNTERIYRTFAEILEKEEDLEFASVMVQKLNMILITSPELADFRRRLKSLETRADGQALFTTLYRSWCHNAVAVFSLCLLAQAYEHASNLLYIFADLEITVQLLVQVDKLVQLIESPVFTYLRLQLLEPEKYPHLFKCLYGLLMLLPQSSAFLSLRNRLNAVNSAGFLHIAPKSTVGNLSSTRSKLGREDIKWQELLQHFRAVQVRHEKARRQALGTDTTSFSAYPYAESAKPPTPPSGSGAGPAPHVPPGRRKVTGDGPIRPPSRTGGMLSPLNPKARIQSGLANNVVPGPQPPGSPTGPTTQIQSKVRRTLSLSRKT